MRKLLQPTAKFQVNIETNTFREYQVLLMLAAGKTVKDIADTPALSAKTISTYRTRILRKLRPKTTTRVE